MTSQSTIQSNLWSLVYKFLSSNWTNLILQGWDLLKRIKTEREVGLYEVLDFEQTLELCDVRGKKARTIQKLIFGGIRLYAASR